MDDFMSNLRHMYLVTLDTTNRMEAKQIFRNEGLQNFYFVYCKENSIDNGLKKAQEIVMSTFARNPKVLSAAQFCIKATPVLAILQNLQGNRRFWTYIPMGGQRLAGQQSAPPVADKLLKTNEYGQLSSQGVEIPKPGDIDPMNVVNADKEVSKKKDTSTSMPEVSDDMSKEQMMVMMQKMMEMMNKPNASREPSKEEIENAGKAVSLNEMTPEEKARLQNKIRDDVQIAQDYNDPDLEKEIEELKNSGAIPSLKPEDIDMSDL